MNLCAFATSPDGLGIPEDRLVYLSFREYRARFRVWQNARRHQQFQWAQLMALTYNMNRASGPARSAYDWLPDENRPPEQPPWVVKDVETQKLSIRQALSFAAAYNEGKQQIN